ncbi:MAG: response regulator [Anaerolineae bacterium]|nr:response regulator [Anaerolineae bacterium]
MVTINTGLLFADILIVDDTPDFARSVRPVLQSAGYIVRRVDSEDALFEALRSQPPDLILLEAALPETDGYDVARHLKAASDLPFVPVIVMKEQSTQADVAAALDAGADEFIAKPVENAELLTRVRAMLRLKATTDALTELTATLEQKVEQRTQELRRAQDSLRHAEKLSALGRLSASIAHEINNPLTAILGHIYLIKQDLVPTSPSRGDLDVVEREVNTISKLVQQLRDFSKPPVRERDRVSINAVVEEVLALVDKQLHKHKVDVRNELDPALPPVLASPDQMREVFLNLILNAQDAMPEGGTLTLRTRVEDGQVIASVGDTGTGIPPDHIDYIFEPFFTTKGKKGTGLGLAICHSIAHDHGGEMCVESQVGAGTVFKMKLPLTETGEM